MESAGTLISNGSKWPAFYVNISQGLINDIAGNKGGLDFTKADLRIDHKINFRFKGFFSYELQAGKVFGNVPYSLQYNNKGSNSARYPFSVERSMETMGLNQFTSTQYAAAFLVVNFGRIIKPREFTRPEIELVQNYAIGSLDNRKQMGQNVPLADISKGYTEAGLRLNNLLASNFSGFGVGVFYRYGNYATGNPGKDVVFKVTLSLAF
jgi:hypothetical protein